MKLKLYLLTALSALALAIPATSLAVSNLTVRLGQPKSPTNQNSLKLTFVALEIGGTDSIAVSCYKKSSSDADFVKFEDKTLIPGGNTDYCTVGSSILSTNGSYSFKVIANGKESNIVSVEYGTSGPSTPHSYSKERISACEYKIKFKTADDGKTAKVEVFRSDTTTINVNPSGKVHTIAIGPNKEWEVINTIPDCNKDFYYVIRAVDAYDNVSGTTGDSYTTTVNTATTTTQVQGAVPVQSGSQVSDGTIPKGSENISGTPTEGSTTGTPEVLGTQTSKWNNLKWLSIPLILLAAYFFHRARRRG